MENKETSPVGGTTLDELKELVLSMKATNEQALMELNNKISETRNFVTRNLAMNSSVMTQLGNRIDSRIEEIVESNRGMQEELSDLRGENNSLRMDMGDIDRNVDEIRSSTGSDKNNSPKKSDKSNRKKVKIDDQKAKAESKKTRSIFSRRTTFDLNNEDSNDSNVDSKDEDEELDDSEDDEIDMKGVKYRKVTSNKSSPKTSEPKQKSSTTSGSTPVRNTSSTSGKSSTVSGSGGDPGDGSDSSDTSDSDDEKSGSGNLRDSNRRLTINPRVPVDLVNGGSENSVSVMVHPYRVGEKDKIRVITLKSMKRLAEIYKEYLATSLDKTKTLIYFIHPDAQKELYTKQGLLHTKIAKDYKLQELYLMKDRHTEKMMADYIRPLGRDEFVETLHRAMTFPRWKPGIKFGVADYYRHIFQHVTLFLDEAEVYYNLLIKKATPRQLGKYPKAEWGSKDPGGLFRILMIVLEPYTDNFIEMLGGEQKLKKIEGLDEFLSRFKQANMDKAKKSREQEEEDSELRKPMSYITSAASARKKHEDFTSYVAKSKTTTSTARVPFTRKTSGRLRILYDDEGNAVPIDESWINPEGEDSQDPDLEEEESTHQEDMTEEELEIAWEEEQKRKADVERMIENWDETFADHEDAKYAANALYALFSGSHKPGSRAFPQNRGNPRIQEQRKPQDQVCFAYAFGKCTDGDKCKYSHDKMKVEDFLWSQFNKLKNSAHWKDAILQRPPPKPQEPRTAYGNHKPGFGGGNGKPYAGRGGIHTPAKKISFGENKVLDLVENASSDPKSVSNSSLPEKPGSSRSAPTGADRADSDV